MERTWSLSPLKIASYLAILIWALMMGMLLKKAYLPSLGHPVRWGAGSSEGLGLKAGESWMGIYLQDRKVGYSVTIWEKEDLDWRMLERTIMELMVMGEPQMVNLSTNCLLDPSLNLKSFRFHMSAGEVRFQADGEMKEKDREMVVQLSGIGEQKELKIPVKEIPFLASNLRFFWKNREMQPGQRFTVPLFDPITLRTENLQIVIQGKERIRIGKEEVEALKLEETFKGMIVHSWVSNDGETLKEESPLGFTLVKEDKETAVLKGRGGRKAEDLIALAAVSSAVKIPNPQAIRLLRVRLGGIDLQGLDLNGGRQRLRDGVLEIEREDLNVQAPELPLRVSSMIPYLESTPFIESDHGEMKQAAASILKGERNALEASRRLASWVFENVEKRPTLSIPSALEVLHRRAGDCNEHTILFAGLARAVGLPTKVDAGLVYARGNFYYHAWPEVYVGRWIAIDPTLNQFPADATHIRLVEGGLERQSELVRLMGKISLEILGFQ